MTSHDQILSTEALAGELNKTRSDWIRCVGRRIVTWADTCADHYAAAAMYEQLSALSDAELMRRGLSRATLAHDVLAACDRVSNAAIANKTRAPSRACSTSKAFWRSSH